MKSGCRPSCMCTTFPFAETLSTGRAFGRLLPEFSHGLCSPERDTTAQACRFSCFFCAAYGLLLTQTRTQCSNSASRAIAMLEKSAKISPNVCAGISLSNECGHVENSYVLINDANFEKTSNFTRSFVWYIVQQKALPIK